MASQGGTMPPDISVIIPVLHESETINETIRALQSQKVGFQGIFEIIVVDGDQAGRTCAAVEDRDVVGLLSDPGRATQMNKGASIAQGNILLFLHADTILDPGSLQQIRLEMENQQYAGGAFDLRIDAPGIIFRIVEGLSSLRSRLTRIPYGDQAIFIRRSIFERIGGYPDIPLMEDVALMRRLKKERFGIGFLDAQAVTSARRWQTEGVVYTTFRNWLLISLYLIGVSPSRLAHFYQIVR